MHQNDKWHGIMQYQEQGTFYAWIHRSELENVLLERIQRGEKLILLGSAKDIASYLIVYEGGHSRDSLMPLLIDRVKNLKQRLSKLLN